MVEDDRPSRRISFAEIVLVVGVLLLTASIVLPVFVNARRAERKASCIGNLQQLGLAFQQYAMDNDQTLFNPYYFGFCDKVGANGFLSNSTLEPYLRNRNAHNPDSVWVCPEITRFSTVRTTSQSGWGAFYCTYTMNVFLNPRRIAGTHGVKQAIPEPDVCYSDIADQAAQTVGWTGSGALEDEMALSEPQYTIPAKPRPKRRPDMLGARIGDIASPAQTDLVFEGVVEGLYRGKTDNGYVGRAPRQGDYTLEQGFWPSQKQAEMFFGKRRGFMLQQATAARHAGVNNYLFCDGHVQAMTPRTYPYDIRHDPNNIWFTRIGRNGATIPPAGGPGCEGGRPGKRTQTQPS